MGLGLRLSVVKNIVSSLLAVPDPKYEKKLVMVMVGAAAQLANSLRLDLQSLKAFPMQKGHLCHFQFSLDFYFCHLKPF